MVMSHSHIIHNSFDNLCWDSRFLFPNPLLSLGEFLVKLSENAPFPVAVRSLDQGCDFNHRKIIMHNKASAEVRGFKEGGQLGLSIPEILDTLTIPFAMKAAELRQIEQNDHEVLKHNHQQSHIQTTLDSEGYVRLYQRIVTPVSGYKSQPVALTSISLELTHDINLLQLFKVYKQYYGPTNLKVFEGIKKCFYYLKLDQYFINLLNYGEMVALLAMVSDARHKEAAELISQFNNKPCTLRNMATYVSLIKEKLKEGIDLYSVLRNLRDHYQPNTFFI
jgi:hypothetical protein